MENSHQTFIHNEPSSTTSLEGENVTVSKRSNLLFPIGLVAIIIAALVGVGGYSLGRQPQTTQEQLVVDITPAAIEPSPSQLSPEPTMIPMMPDLTGDWETYTGTEYSFKHPKNVQFDTNGAETGVENIRFHFMGQKQIDSGRTQSEISDGYIFIVSKRGLASDKTPAEWAVASREQNMQQCLNFIPEATFTQPQKVSFADTTGMQFSSKNCRGDFTSTYLNHNNTIYEITQLYTGDEVDQPQYQEITNQMLKSLKFL